MNERLAGFMPKKFIHSRRAWSCNDAKSNSAKPEGLGPSTAAGGGGSDTRRIDMRRLRPRARFGAFGGAAGGGAAHGDGSTDPTATRPPGSACATAVRMRSASPAASGAPPSISKDSSRSAGFGLRLDPATAPHAGPDWSIPSGAGTVSGSGHKKRGRRRRCHSGNMPRKGPSPPTPTSPRKSAEDVGRCTADTVSQGAAMADSEHCGGVSPRLSRAQGPTVPASPLAAHKERSPSTSAVVVPQKSLGPAT
mmetsp:Transcript_106670/g.244222  ORF Transcript_106670/g.244222 Transcript_106670/m.244222 type:complete len:251 (-) Transcript_106670:1737-2489(-)